MTLATKEIFCYPKQVSWLFSLLSDVSQRFPGSEYLSLTSLTTGRWAADKNSRASPGMELKFYNVCVWWAKGRLAQVVRARH